MPYGSTESLCPVCLQKIPAYYHSDGNFVILHKTCPHHGVFSSPVWKIYNDGPDFLKWSAARRNPAYPARPAMQRNDGCPFDCGLCPDHEQHTCTGLIEVTSRCSLGCPVCYAQSSPGGKTDDPPEEKISEMLDALYAASGPCHVQFSGGEPSERDDLPELIRLAADKHFPLIQINTNGLRLSRDKGYAEQLKASGLDSVYLQFDGLDDSIYTKLRGKALIREKLSAIQSCKAAGLGIVLVCTLVRGINDGCIGDLLDFAVNQGNMVRGIHFQPVSSFGRFPRDMSAARRITLPELMHMLEDQTEGKVRISHFHPPSCEHPLCSFSAVFSRADGGLSHQRTSSCLCCGESQNGIPELIDNAEGSRIAKAFTAAHWRAPEKSPDGIADDFDKFIALSGMERRFTISAMGFQDAYSLDINRLKTCCIHIVDPDGRLIPFCIYNLTSQDGASLYRNSRRIHSGPGSAR